MKRQFQFYFADEPQYSTTESREYIAHLLRAYRRYPNRYELKRIAPHPLFRKRIFRNIPAARPERSYLSRDLALA